MEREEAKVELYQALDLIACSLPRDDDGYVNSFPVPSSSSSSSSAAAAADANAFFNEYGFVVFRDVFSAQGI